MQCALHSVDGMGKRNQAPLSELQDTTSTFSKPQGITKKIFTLYVARVKCLLSISKKCVYVHTCMYVRLPFWLRDLRERHHLADLRVNGRIILKWIKTWDEAWTGLETCDNEPSGSIKCGVDPG